MDFFTADPHFGHKNIIEYERRPYKDENEMNAALIRNWNETISERDSVWVLGDLGLRHGIVREILPQLNGTKFLVKGNHDKRPDSFYLQWFVWVKEYAKIKIQIRGAAQDVVLSHYPFETWDKSHYGSWHLHGHCHGSLPDSPHKFRLDVGVDSHGWYPCSSAQVYGLMQTKTFVPVDHHRRPWEENGAEQTEGRANDGTPTEPNPRPGTGSDGRDG